MSDDSTAQPGRATRRPDIAIAVAVAVVQVGGTVLTSQHQAQGRHWDALGVALLATGPVVLVARRRWPVAVLAATFAATLAYSTIGYARGPIWAALIVAFGTAVITGHRRAAQLSLVAGYLGFLWLPPVLDRGPGPSAAAALGLLAWLLLLLSIAEVVRSRRQRAIQAELTRKQEAERRAGEERLRIAREVHDLVAHNMSLINVQASTALHLMDGEPERARVALEAIKKASKDALVELRSVLGVLRRVDEDAPRSPTPGIDRLDELLAGAASAGLAVDLIVDGDRRSLPPTADVAAYRIVQEALTNVARHAEATAATVRLAYGDAELVVQVDDDGRNRPAGTRGGPAGNGISGMRERAAVLGGTLQAGPRPEGGFRVRAWLPVEDNGR